MRLAYQKNLPGQVEGSTINYIPAGPSCTAAPQTCTKQILEEFAVEIENAIKTLEEEQEGEAEKKEAFAAYYMFQVDRSAQSYSIAVYGNQVAAASSPNFGATMLQTIAQDVSGVADLKLELRNNLLPINNRLLPTNKPATVELFAVSACAAVIYLMYKQADWHGRPISSGFHNAYVIKAGSKSGYLCSKYVKLIVSNLILVSALVLMIYGQKLAIEGAGGILLFWILLNPIYVMAMSSAITLSRKRNYRETKKYLMATSTFIGALAMMGVGVISESQGKQISFWYFVMRVCPLPPALMFQVLESSFLYQLAQLIENRETFPILPVNLDPHNNENSFFWTDTSVMGE